MAYGGDDIWVGWVDSTGRKLFERSYGGKGNEKPHSIHPLDTSGLVIIGTSTASGISGNKTVDGDGTWILHVDDTGLQISEFLLPDVRPETVMAAGNAFRLFVRDDLSLWMEEIRLVRNYTLRASAGPEEAVSVQSSADLQTWTTVAYAIRGSVEIEEIASDARRFFRIAPAE